MRKLYKYITLWSYYLDCPSCDSHETCSELEFFDRIKDVFEKVKEDFGQRELISIYWIDGSPLDVPDYKYFFHKVVELTWKYKKLNFKLVDNGHGKKIWLKDNIMVNSLYDKK